MPGRRRLPRSTPEDQGVSSRALLALIDDLERSSPELHSLMVLRHGAVLAEGWWAPFAADRAHQLFSLSKSFTSAAVAPLADASAESLHAFVSDHVEPGSTVITDAWQGYRGLEKLGYVHDRRSQRAAKARGDDPGELLPAVHRVASLIKRWLLGTHQGAVDPAHLPSYMNEFVFRFNRRRSRSRGLVFYRLLELVVDHEPVRYRELIATKRPPTTLTRPLGRGNPPSLERPPAKRPWRSPDQGSSA